MKNALLINVSEIGDIVSSTIVVDSLIQNGFDVDFLIPEFVHTLFQHEETITLWSPENIPGLKATGWPYRQRLLPNTART